MNATRICTTEECGESKRTRGMCHKHYTYWWRNHKGQRPIAPRFDPDLRFWNKVNKSDECWIWAGHKSPRGYGAFRFNGRVVRAHRYAWESSNGPIPEGLEIDHQCRVTSCVNPSHLKIVTRDENQQNKGLSKNNTSGFKGVYRKKGKKKWAAQVTYQGAQMHLGYFDSASEAGRVAREKRLELFTNNIYDMEGGPRE